MLKISGITRILGILRYNMNDSKRVHIGHFVLIFQYKKEEDLILFDDFEHHDTIYK